MKTPITLLLAISILISCESATTDNTSDETKQEEQQEQNETKEKSGPTYEDDDRVSGFFNIEIDGKTYKSSQLQDNYCDMTFMYKEEKSFVTIRLKDDESNDALLLTFYGGEEYMLDPTGKTESFMFSDADAKVNVQFLPGNGNGSIMSLTMVEGSIDVTEFSKGHIEATFDGKGGKPKDVITKKNLLPFKGEIKLETTNVTEMGKDKVKS